MENPEYFGGNAKGFNASPAGQHSEGHRSNRKRFRDITNNFFVWEKKRLPTPGALNYAFETLMLPEFSPIGTGVPYHNLEIGLHPSYMASSFIPTAGLGGITFGQPRSQPLTDQPLGPY